MSHREYIDFISAYCDGWCERCAFTSRCSLFATRCAIAMCGDIGEALELAVGHAPKEDSDSPAEPDPPLFWLDELEEDANMAGDVADERAREMEARRRRVGETPIMQAAHAYSMLAHRWLAAEHETLVEQARAAVSHEAGADVDQQARSMDAQQVIDALDVISWDHTLIPAKLHRALTGLDERRSGESDEDHPVQNDSNGSAKVALISLDRSEAAWQVLAHWTGTEGPQTLARHLAQLRREVEAAFPDAWRFVRPGFDEPAESVSDG